MKDRDHDLVLFGATGFTGRLVATYLLEHGPEGLRWALAGRSAQRLEAVREDLAERHLGAADLPILVADAHDRPALDAVARSARVVCSTVGPYAQHGADLVAACAAAGTHYCDLTGEVPFVRSMIDAHDAEARATGARLVHCCGFDSVPSDLGCLMVGDALLERGARPHGIALKLFLGEARGGVSGGTVASLLGIAEGIATDPDLRRVLGDPHALDPEPRVDRDEPDQIGVRWDADLEMWTAPFVMASVNTRVVRRSHALRGRPYGEDFRYAEAMSTGRGVAGFGRAAAITLVVGAFLAAVRAGPLRGFLERRVLPKPGEGPSRAQQDEGFFVMRLLGQGSTEAGQPVRVRGEVRGEKDPGYGETAKMLGESALCLAFDDLPGGGGSLTPASAMGPQLLERLRRAGMTFEVA